jgi:hypothetical protein
VKRARASLDEKAAERALVGSLLRGRGRARSGSRFPTSSQRTTMNATTAVPKTWSLTNFGCGRARLLARIGVRRTRISPARTGGSRGRPSGAGLSALRDGPRRRPTGSCGAHAAAPPATGSEFDAGACAARGPRGAAFEAVARLPRGSCGENRPELFWHRFSRSSAFPVSRRGSSAPKASQVIRRRRLPRRSGRAGAPDRRE